MRRTIALLLLALAGAGAEVLTPGNVAYVVDHATGQVWVVDLTRKRMDTGVATGAGSSEMLVLPNNHFGFVSNHDAGTVSVIDLWTNKVQSTVALGQGPGPSGLAATPDGLLLYVANVENNTVSVIDTPSLSVVATLNVGNTPVQVNIEPRGRYAYVVNQGGNTISVIDISRQKVVKVLAAGLQPNQFAILPNRNIAYMVNKGSNDLTLVDLTTNQATGARVTVGDGPVSVAHSTDSSRLYVVNSLSNTISVLDTASNVQIKTIAFDAGDLRPVAMAVNHDSTIGYVACQGSNTVLALDLRDNSVSKRIGVGHEPSSLVLDPNEGYLYVTNMGSGSVSVINLATGNLTDSISGPGGESVPVQFVMLNPPTLLEIAPNPAVSGSRVALTGEGFLPSSIVLVSPSGENVARVSPQALNSQVLQMDLPSYPDSQAQVQVLNPDGSSSARVTLRGGNAAPRIETGGVVEAAGFAPAPSPISGNAIVAVFGSFPGMARADAPVYQFPLPTSLGNARVTLNGVPAPLLATFPGQALSQINAVAPLELLALDDVRVAVTVGDQTSPVETINVAPASPGIFALDANKTAAATHADYTLITTSHPAALGEIVTIYVTGLGGTNPPPIEGDAAPSDTLARTLLPVKVFVATVESPKVDFSGLTPGFSGLYQINFQVPMSQLAVGIADVKVVVGGQESIVAKMAVR